jgi:hypothetical protein
MMAKFRAGQRVRVPRNTPTVEIALYDCEGMITFIGPSQTIILAGVPDSPLEQEYSVKFETPDTERFLRESELELVDES